MAIVTRQELEDASVDAATLETVVNGPATPGTLTSRTGTPLKTLAKIIDDLSQQDISASVLKSVTTKVTTLDNILGLLSSGMPTGAVGIWFMKNYDPTYKTVPNLVTADGSINVLKLITRHPRGVFESYTAGSGGWLSLGGLTITERYANGRDGYQLATRAVFGAANTASIRYAASFTLPAGTYTMVIDAKSNGSNQLFTMSNDGGTTVSTFLATNTLTQFKREFTLASPATFDGRFLTTIGGAAGDFTIDKAFLWDGNSASVPADLIMQGDMYIGHSNFDTGPTVINGKLRMPNGEVGSIDFGQLIVSNEVSLFAVVRRIAAYNNTAGYYYPFLYNPAAGIGEGANQLIIGEYESLGNLIGYQNYRSLVATEDHKLSIDDDQFHVVAFRGNSNSLSLWLEDVELQTNNLANTTYSLAKLQCGNSNGGFGMRKFEINALAFYKRRLTDEETRQAVNALIVNAAKSGISINKKKNSLIAAGDLITSQPTTGYLALYKANVAQPVVIQNEAIVGSMIELSGTSHLNLETRFPLHVGSVPTNAADRTGRQFVHTIFIGANDLNSYADAATFLVELWKITTVSKNAGAKVGVATILPKGTAAAGYASHNSKRAVANPLIRAAVGTQFDFVIDFAANADMGTDADANNTAKYSDGIHPTSAGHVFLEVIYRAAVNPWLVASASVAVLGYLIEFDSLLITIDSLLITL